MADIFDQLTAQQGQQQPQGDIFDHLAAQAKQPAQPQQRQTIQGPTPSMGQRALNLLPNVNPEAIPNAINAQPQIAKDLETIPTNFLNQLTMNHLRSVNNSQGGAIPFEAQNPAINAVAKGAGVAGAVMSPLNKLAIMKTMGAGGMAGKVASGGLAGLAYAPNDNSMDLKARALQGVGGAIAGPVASKAIEGVGNIISGVKNVKNPVQFAQDVRKGLFTQKAQVGKEFGAAVDKLAAANPNIGVDLSQPMQSLKSAMANEAENPGLAGQVKGIIKGIKDPNTAKLVNDILEDPSKASKLTLQQSNNIKTAIQNAPALATKLKQGKFAQYNSGDLEMLDLLDHVKLAQGENFPELAGIRKPYAQYMQNYSQVKNMFKPASLLTKMKNGFGNEEIDAMIKHVLPDATSKDIKNYRSTLTAIKAAKVVGGIGATAVGGKALMDVGKKIIGN